MSNSAPDASSLDPRSAFGILMEGQQAPPSLPSAGAIFIVRVEPQHKAPQFVVEPTDRWLDSCCASARPRRAFRIARRKEMAVLSA